MKKKQRLSSKSDDVKIDESMASDNEDVFEAPKLSPKIQIDDSTKIERLLMNDNHPVPNEIIERYHHLVTEESKVG